MGATYGDIQVGQEAGGAKENVGKNFSCGFHGEKQVRKGELCADWLV